MNKNHVVYFIQDTNSGPIKIGITKDIQTRFGELQRSSPIPLKILKTINGEKELEDQIHKHFKHLQQHGEWFQPAKELLDFITSPDLDILSSNIRRKDEYTRKYFYLHTSNPTHMSILDQINNKTNGSAYITHALEQTLKQDARHDIEQEFLKNITDIIRTELRRLQTPKEPLEIIDDDDWQVL